MAIFKFLKSLGLKTKLIILYFFTIFIPLLIISQSIIIVSCSKIISQSMELNMEAARQTRENIAEMLKQNLAIVNKISFDRRLVEYLDLYSAYTGQESWNAYLNYLDPLSIYVNDVMQQKIKIYYLNGSLVPDNRVYFYAGEYSHLPLYQKALGNNFKPVWHVEGDKIFLGKAMNGNNYEVIAVLAVELPERDIHSFFNINNNGEKTVIVCDGEGTVLSSNDRKIIGTSIIDRKYLSNFPVGRMDAVDYRDGGYYKVIRQSLKFDESMLPDWKIISIIPLDHIINESQRIRNLGIIISGLCLTFSTLIFFLLLDRMTARIRKLVEGMQSVRDGSFMTLEDGGVKDEIGLMVESFNIMVESLRKLIYENYEAKLQMKDIKIKKREAELYALQSQINPHFLFNTLESIRLGLYNKDLKKTADVLLNLSKMLRKSLNWKGEFITLADELELVENYLSIQQYRFSDKIKYTVDVPEELLDCRILKLTVQPLVENAVIHGIEKKWGSGTVSVCAECTNSMIKIWVEDDGVGMDRDKLDKILPGLGSGEEIKKSGSIGIRNVNDRLRLHYGVEFGLQMESIKNAGTKVTVIMPRIMDNENEGNGWITDV